MQIHWRNPGELTEKQREEAEKKLRRLAGGRDDLIDLWVDVGRNAHHRTGTQEVSIRCQARGADLVAHGRDIEVRLALRNALQAFEREVHRLRGRRTDKRTEQPVGPPVHGVVDRLFPEQDHGFLIIGSGENVYFHRNAVGGGLEFDSLEEGQTVALNYEPGDNGLQATVVRRPLGEPG